MDYIGLPIFRNEFVRRSNKRAYAIIHETRTSKQKNVCDISNKNETVAKTSDCQKTNFQLFSSTIGKACGWQCVVHFERISFASFTNVSLCSFK